MKIYLTFDYELFFGETPGSVQKCLLEPTEELLRLAQTYQIGLTFFVDVGYLIKLKEYAVDYVSLREDRNLVFEQLKQILRNGHALQLHVHPHWEKSYYLNGKWQIHTDGCYRLSDFSKVEAASIIDRYNQFLIDEFGVVSTAFRAGGWCVQPFEHIREALLQTDIRIDSSVFAGGSFSSSHYDFDFTTAPNLDRYSFNSDVCIAEQGPFMEVPIASLRYSPIFYWKLYILGRIFPLKHKMIGDGKFLAQPGRKKRVLTKSIQNHVSTDGYYVTKLPKAVKVYQKENKKELVVIGHPKSCTYFSLVYLENFLKTYVPNNQFLALR